jgi:hypothetical protein
LRRIRRLEIRFEANWPPSEKVLVKVATRGVPIIVVRVPIIVVRVPIVSVLRLGCFELSEQFFDALLEHFRAIFGVFIEIAFVLMIW